MNPAERRLLARARELGAADDTTQPVPSPCVSVCRMDASSGLCEGCWRSLEEIAGWSRLPDADKRAIWARIEARVARKEAA